MATSNKTMITSKCIVTKKRDGDMSPVYVCTTMTNGDTYSNRIPLNVEVDLDDNVIKSLKRRTEMARVPSAKGTGKGESLESRSMYLIEKV